MEPEAKTGRTFTEGEAYALVSDGIARETAEAQATIKELKDGQTALQTRVDVLETEKAQEKQRADEAVTEFEKFKAKIASDAEELARKAERVKQVAEANPLLEMTDVRQSRIAAMDEDNFVAYLADMREVASKSEPKPGTETPPAGDPPRESAAFGSDPLPKIKADTVGGYMSARDAILQTNA